MSKISKQFLTVTFAIMAIFWGTCVICSFCGLSLKQDYYLYFPYMIGGLSPTIASFVVLKKNGQVRSFKEWLNNVFDIKHGIASYLLVVVLSVIYVLPQCIVAGYEKGAPLYAIIVMIPVMLLGGDWKKRDGVIFFSRSLKKVPLFRSYTYSGSNMVAMAFAIILYKWRGSGR